MKKKLLLVANWKLHGSFEFNHKMIDALKQSLKNIVDLDIVICPPTVYLTEIHRVLQDSTLEVGAQNVSNELSGAFTGEVSASMLAEIGCNHVIIGHMERRLIYGEDKIMVAQKFKNTQEAGLIPILCVGETSAQRKRGEQRQVIAEQLTSVKDMCQGSRFEIAYEPGWAIGTGKVASIEQVTNMHDFIYQHMTEDLHIDMSQVRVIYGGSIKTDNAADLFEIKHVDGGLVGAAALDSEAFSLICQSACSVKEH